MVKQKIQEKIKEIIHKNKVFYYLSYDHKLANEEYRKTPQGMANIHPVNCYNIPQEFKDKFPVWRKGKLRQVNYDPNGDIKNLKIGAKYPITIYWTEWGKKVKL